MYRSRLSRQVFYLGFSQLHFLGLVPCTEYLSNTNEMRIAFVIHSQCNRNSDRKGAGYSVVISTEFSGITNGKIFVLKDIPAGT